MCFTWNALLTTTFSTNARKAQPYISYYATQYSLSLDALCFLNADFNQTPQLHLKCRNSFKILTLKQKLRQLWWQNNS